MPIIEKDRIRITARVPASLHERLEEAAGLSGSTLNQFVVEAAADRAHAVLERETAIRLSRESAEQVLALLDNPPAANNRLRAAIRLHRKHLRGS